MTLRLGPDEQKTALMHKLAPVLCLVLACTPAREPPAPVRSLPSGSAEPLPEQAPAPEPAAGGDISLIESLPLETLLGHPAIADTAPTWLAMIAEAKTSIELCHFYASSEPGELLEPVIEALAAAADRGVRVRMLLDPRLSDTYAATYARLESVVELRRWDAAAELGGIQHAKYLLVDGTEVLLGSANFDWRSLSHIHEIGVRVRSTTVAHQLADLFELDWVLAAPGATPRPDLQTDPWKPVDLGDGAQVQLVASPRGWLPDESAWELDQLLELIAGARETLSIELLEYDAAFRDGSPFATLDDALRAAAARGVKVALLLSHWQLRHPGAAQRLQRVEGIDVGIVTIPPHSSGFIPFARVSHAKYAVADGEIAWIGSSNWQGDYFHLSRNVGVVVRGGAIATQLQGVLDQLASSPYVRPLDPEAVYEPPRVAP